MTGLSPVETAARIEAWFAAHARDLPWRCAGSGTPRDPYHALVAEVMLQQTQAARAAERFPAFIARFPTVADLAAAEEADVLALWSGLGYYRRARSLHAAARRVMDEHAGRLPTTAAELRALPGVGRYTAGAIASIALGRREPIVDANVARVLLRLDGRAEQAAVPATQAWAWGRAAALVEAASDPAACNEGLMELGALVCTPAAPRCPSCPLADRCRAHREGRQHEIPPPKTRARRRELFLAAAICKDARGRLLVEPRPSRGLWAGLLQPPTIEREDREPTAADLSAAGFRVGAEIDRFTHATTHRECRFVAYEASGARAGGGRAWVSRRALAGRGLGTPQRRLLLGE